MPRRRTLGGLLLACMIATLPAVGCGPSQEDYDQKLREIDKLKSALAAEQASNKQAHHDLTEALARIEQLKDDLKKAGVDISNLNASLTEQARALDDYKKRAEQLDQIRKKFELLKQKLDALTKLGLKVVIRKNRMVIQLPGDVLFDSGAETLKSEGKKILGQVADVIRGDAGLSARTFQVAGHTDSQALNGGPFKDNWGLSAMRAREVLVFLVQPTEKGGGGLKSNQWSAVGYGDTDPIQGNDSMEGRQANRRVELVVVPNVEEMINLEALTK